MCVCGGGGLVFRSQGRVSLPTQWQRRLLYSGCCKCYWVIGWIIIIIIIIVMCGCVSVIVMTCS